MPYWMAPYLASRQQRLRSSSRASHPARQPCHPGKSCSCGFSHVGLEQHIAWHPYVTVSDYFQISPQDRDVPAVIRVTFTISVTTVTLKCIFALTSR